jgi:CHRD domain-containing protein
LDPDSSGKGEEMKRALLVVSILALALVAYGDNGGRRFTVVLTGAEEAPGPGDPDGIGFATLRLNPGTQQVCFNIRVENITLPATGAHIHEAAAGSPGPIVIGLTAPDESGSSSGCVDADREEILEIIRHPEDYYVNVHTQPDFGAGAVRAQLSK